MRPRRSRCERRDVRLQLQQRRPDVRPSALPVEEGKATINASAVGYTRSPEALAGRFSTVGVLVPIFNGSVEGLLAGKFESRTRHGVGDVLMRFAVNLAGAPAMTPKQFAGYRQTTIVGFSVVVVAPTGQYDPSRIINLGANRWAFNPEVGFSRRRGHWTVEADAGGAFFMDNSNFNNGATREQAPIAAIQGHLTFTVRQGLWVAADGNFWRGGRTTVNGVDSTVEQSNSRVGFTVALPIKTRQIRIACAFGAYTRIGGDFTSTRSASRTLMRGCAIPDGRTGPTCCRPQRNEPCSDTGHRPWASLCGRCVAIRARRGRASHVALEEPALDRVNAGPCSIYSSGS